jgi:F420-0:gamma-glutamyl ligase
MREVTAGIRVMPIRGIPLVRPGDDLGKVIFEAASRSGCGLERGDVVVVCQKVVSKAEGRLRRLSEVAPSLLASELGRESGKDPRLLQVVLDESNRVVKAARGRLICETGPGWVVANAGVDESNSLEPGTVTLLPADPDASARRIADRIRQLCNVAVAVIVTDTFGRPWREGQVEVALGCAGIAPLVDYRGRRDLAGKELRHTVVAVADELAAAAGLVMEKDEGVAAAVVRGYRFEAKSGSGRELLRARAEDLFR